MKLRGAQPSAPGGPRKPSRPSPAFEAGAAPLMEESMAWKPIEELEGCSGMFDIWLGSGRVCDLRWYDTQWATDKEGRLYDPLMAAAWMEAPEPPEWVK